MISSDHDFEKHFKWLYAGHCQDRLSANLKQAKATKHRFKREKRKIKRLDLPCDVHLLAGVVTKAWGIVDWHISGLLAMAVAQRGGGKLDSLREMIGVRCVAILYIRRRSH